MSRSILLCLAFPPPWSGEETLALSLKSGLEALAPDGLEFVYFDVGQKHSNASRGRLTFQNVFKVGRLLFDFAGSLKRIRPEGVFVPLAQNRFGFLKYSAFIRLASFFNCRVFSLLGGAEFDRFYGRMGPLFRRWVLGTLKKLKILIVQGEGLRRQFEGLVPSEKLRVVPPGLPFPEACAGQNRGDKKTVDVLYVGCLSEAKGTLDLLKAVPSVAARIRNIHFHLAGEILEKERNLKHLAQSASGKGARIRDWVLHPEIRPHVTWHGVVTGKEKSDLYRMADIFVHPSRSESFPCVLLEAAASGLAIAATPVGSNPEVYREEENLLFFRPGDAGDLAEKLVQLAKDPLLRERMGANNARLVRQNYTDRRFAERMQEIFKERA